MFNFKSFSILIEQRLLVGRNLSQEGQNMGKDAKESVSNRPDIDPIPSSVKET